MRYLTLSADHLRPQLRDVGDPDATPLDSLSEELRDAVERWNDDYQVVVPMDPPARRAAADLVAALDDRGLDLAHRIAAELHPAEVAYFQRGPRETARVTTSETHAEAAYADLAARAHDQGWERLVGSSTWWLLLDGLFVEVELDEREGSAYVLVGPLRDGARPGGYYLDASGARVRWHLGAALELAGLPRRTAAADLGGTLGDERVRRALDAHREDVTTALAHLDELVAALEEAR